MNYVCLGAPICDTSCFVFPCHEKKNEFIITVPVSDDRGLDVIDNFEFNRNIISI